MLHIRKLWQSGRDHFYRYESHSEQIFLKVTDMFSIIVTNRETVDSHKNAFATVLFVDWLA